MNCSGHMEAVFELDQDKGGWSRIEGMADVEGRWQLVGAEENEVAVHAPRVRRLE